MSEQQTPVLEKSTDAQTPAVSNPPPAPAAPNRPSTPPVKPAKRRKKKQVGKIIAAVIVVALVIAAAVAIWYFVFREVPEEQGDILTGMVMRGSISSMVEGSGVATAKDSATITLTSAGTVYEVFVAEGDMVNAGDPLYTIKSETAELAVNDAREAYEAKLDEMSKLNEELGELTIRAPHPGKLMEVKALKAGDDVAKGDTIATLVNDTKLRLHLYYNYIYENDIKVGQSAEISVPAVMNSWTGTVETINKVSRIFPEGGKGFEVILVLDNPGTLTADMDASAALTGADGAPIYPYENGKLEYYESTEVKAKATGPVTQSNLLNYADVSAGAVLMTLGDKEIASQITEKQSQVTDAAKKLSEAQEALNDFNAVAPISGRVFSCALVPGQEVKSGDTAITISDTSTMSVEVTVDDRNIRYVSVGQPIDLQDYEGNMFFGTVASVDLTGKSENGMTTYPVKVTVDNMDGSLVNGVYLRYSFAASQSMDCLTVPVQAVNSISDAEGNLLSVVYIQAETPPDNVVELPEGTVSAAPEGFYPVAVEVGLSDISSVEIKSGVNDGDTVFLGYQKENPNGGMMYG